MSIILQTPPEFVAANRGRLLKDPKLIIQCAYIKSVFHERYYLTEGAVKELEAELYVYLCPAIVYLEMTRESRRIIVQFNYPFPGQ